MGLLLAGWGRLAAAKQTWGGGDRRRQHSLGDPPAARRLSRERESVLRRGKNSSCVSGQYLFGKRRDRTYGGSSAGLQRAGTGFAIYLPAWGLGGGVAVGGGPAAPSLVGSWTQLGVGERVTGGTWVSPRPLGPLTGWRLYHLFRASRRCQEMCSEGALAPAVLQLRQAVPAVSECA